MSVFVPTPRELYGSLFDAVQLGRVFRDSKTFVDAVPRGAPGELVRRYEHERQVSGFDLAAFVDQHFILPETRLDHGRVAPDADVRTQIDTLWQHLTRPADEPVPHASLIPLPHPYVVPGGRFRELYYWDSYFTMLGLAASGRAEAVEQMVGNFASLIDRVGFVPNGNRSYYCTRSQPPFFVLMIELLASLGGGASAIDRYGAQLEREYHFWMAGSGNLGATQRAARRVAMVNGTLLNRYWDDAAEPRQESYREDVELAAATARDATQLYRDLRAACESGWDFSSRWFGTSPTLGFIRTTQILPVDLNCLMHRVESVLASVKERAGDVQAADEYRTRAASRRDTIRSLFFDEASGFFQDVDLDDLRPTGASTLAGAFPLFFGLATEDQARRVAARLEQEFMRPGGWATTLRHTGEQWDAPNGWAPLQYIVFEGLSRYGHERLAREGARRWIETCTTFYRASGSFMEKYNVEEPSLAGSGGEYAVQDGFGWTNGVLLHLLDRVTD